MPRGSRGLRRPSSCSPSPSFVTASGRGSSPSPRPTASICSRLPWSAGRCAPRLRSACWVVGRPVPCWAWWADCVFAAGGRGAARGAGGGGGAGFRGDSGCGWLAGAATSSRLLWLIRLTTPALVVVLLLVLAEWAGEVADHRLVVRSLGLGRASVGGRVLWARGGPGFVVCFGWGRMDGAEMVGGGLFAREPLAPGQSSIPGCGRRILFDARAVVLAARETSAAAGLGSRPRADGPFGGRVARLADAPPAGTPPPETRRALARSIDVAALAVSAGLGRAARRRWRGAADRLFAPPVGVAGERWRSICRRRHVGAAALGGGLAVRVPHPSAARLRRGTVRRHCLLPGAILIERVWPPLLCWVWGGDGHGSRVCRGAACADSGFHDHGSGVVRTARGRLPMDILLRGGGT